MGCRLMNDKDFLSSKTTATMWTLANKRQFARQISVKINSQRERQWWNIKKPWSALCFFALESHCGQNTLRAKIARHTRMWILPETKLKKMEVSQNRTLYFHQGTSISCHYVSFFLTQKASKGPRLSMCKIRNQYTCRKTVCQPIKEFGEGKGLAQKKTGGKFHGTNNATVKLATQAKWWLT